MKTKHQQNLLTAALAGTLTLTTPILAQEAATNAVNTTEALLKTLGDLNLLRDIHGMICLSRGKQSAEGPCQSPDAHPSTGYGDHS